MYTYTMKRSSWIIAASIACGLAFASLILTKLSPISIGDTGIYHSYASKIWQGAVPYRDVPLEYLPAVLPFILLAEPLGRLAGDYTSGFNILTALAVFVLLWSISKYWGRRQLLLMTGMCLVFGTFIFFELDIFSVLALFGAFLTYRRGRYDWSALLLALTVLFKAYPILCLPILLLGMPHVARRRYALIVGLVIVAGLLPFFILSPVGLYHTFTYHTGRPLQIESGPAAIGFGLHLFGEPIRIFESHKSVALDFPLAKVLNGLSSIVLFVSILAAYIFLYLRGRAWQDYQKVATSCMLLLMIFIIFFKVGSPQYLLLPISLLPFAETEIGWWRVRQLWLGFTLIGVVVNGLLYSSYVWDIHPQWYGGMLVMLRSIFELATVGWLLHILRYAPSPSGPGKGDQQ